MNKKILNECPTNCPFLGMRSFLPSTLPFYCEKYETFLGMNPAKKVVCCALCLGIPTNIQQQGLELLEANGNHSTELKRAFLQMRPGDQQKVVHILSQTGAQIQWPTDKKPTAVSLLAEIMRLGYEKKKSGQSPEVQEFLKLLDVIATGGDPLDSVTKTLLSNLFQVLDNSEKSMLLGVLENPARTKAFLNIFFKMPHDQNLLKNFRLLLYDADSKNKEEERSGNQALVFEKGKALNLTQHMQLQHLMQLMRQVRQHKQRTRD